MQLEYKILWLDDEPLKSSISRIERYIKTEFAFIPEIIKVSTEEELKKKKLNFKDFDLILLDYQLSNKKTTDNILKEIKSKNFYSEIFFYSSKVKFLEHVKTNITVFEGVYFQEGRSDLIPKIKEIINLTLKKVQDVNNLRGLVMAETGDLDSLKEDILEIFFRSTSDSKNTIKEKIIKKLKEDNITLTGLIEKLESNEDKVFIDFFKDSADLHTKSCNVHRINKVNKQLNFNHEIFRVDVLEPRNNLAHVKAEIVGGEKILKGKKSTLVFSNSYCKEMRNKIIKYKSVLEEIKKELN